MKDSEKRAKRNADIDLCVTNALDKQAETISPKISDRLDAARFSAIAEPDSKLNSNPGLLPWLPAMGTCAALLLVVVMLNIPDSSTPTLADGDQDLVLEVVLTNQDMDLMEEDLEFYLWLAEQNS
ncbi:hypothetical protein GP2143_08529 [marine gamma proteobacterium HTCC2143]|uniref:Uncharacterized protein n=1 Tax=marine gamma proteobacterium HTCC2143 TaxID=247633 RepID=A0YCR3_9GAMM|nr:hypothetical protein GP2143_08529 [marine gamma proteobacterium HTCC2143]